MLRGVGDVVQVLAGALPPWAMALLVGTVLLIAMPAWIRSGKGKRIKGDIRRMVRAEGERLVALREETLRRAGRDPHLLELTIKEGRRREQYALAAAALEALRALPDTDDFVARVEAPPKPEKSEKRWGHPIEAAAAIEVMLENGAVAAAAERLAEVRSRFPDDEELARLERRVNPTAEAR